MILSSTTATANTTSTTTSSTSDSTTDPAAAQDRFLTLLVAQLNNQDPLNPLDNAQMTSQIAQINTVTGIQQLNETVTSLADQFNSLIVMQGTSLVGRGVLTEGSSVAMNDKTGSGGFELSSAATGVTVDILDSSGQVVDTIDMGAQSAGRHIFEWDGSNYSGSTTGLQFRVTAVNGSTKLESTPLALSKITASGAEDGQLVLSLSNGTTVNYSQIKTLV